MDMLAGIRIAKKLDGQIPQVSRHGAATIGILNYTNTYPRYSDVDILTIIEDLAATTFHKVKNVSPELMKCV
jgi:hypothetical protein